MPEPVEEGAEQGARGRKRIRPENPRENVEAPEIVEERAPVPVEEEGGKGKRQEKTLCEGARGGVSRGGAGKYLKSAETGKKKIHKSLTNKIYQKHLKALTTKLMNKRASEGNPISEEDALAHKKRGSSSKKAKNCG